MPASFLHGVETIEVDVGPVPVTVVKSAVIGLVGSAPRWAVPVSNPAGVGAAETPTLVSSQRDASMFGPLIRGYSIPYALAAIQEQGAGQAIVVDVFNPSVHQTLVANQALTMPASGPQVVNLGHMGIVGPGLAGGTYATTVVVKNSAGTTTYVENTDYTVDYINGLVTAKTGGAIAAGEALEISFAYCDPSKVADTDLVGAVSGGAYTGIQALQLGYSLFGFFPKILIAPAAGMLAAGVQSAGSQDPAVASALTTMASTIRAMALIDAPPATPVATAISNRALAGNPFDTSSDRAILCFPWQQFTDEGLNPAGVTISSSGAPLTAAMDATEDSPLSQWTAGAIAAKDAVKGYWWSPSNTELSGVLGPDLPLYASVVDPNSDVNNLNAQGIVTTLNTFGTGLRTWGNRSAAYPASTTPDTFVSVRRTMDIIEESVELAMLQFIDQPISNALISAILASVNSFIRTLIQRGALVAGSASYNPAENPPAQVSAGQLVFDIDVMPPPPAERITFNVFVDSGLLAQLGQTNALGASA